MVYDLPMTLILIVILALIFDYINGFHDTANAIALSIQTKALTPLSAVILAAIFNFLGALAGTTVAETIGSKLVDPKILSSEGLSVVLISAIIWNLITWWKGLPSSSSHALIGGILGLALISSPWEDIFWLGFLKVILFLIIAPILGLAIAKYFMKIMYRVFSNPNTSKVNVSFRRLQVVSASFMAFSHGSNDAQKSMAIITMALVSHGSIETFYVPLWVTVACAFAMALGTLAGGWRIIKTVGSGITKITPINGFTADITGSLIIYGSSLLGLPISTTHVVSSAIMGVGWAKHFTAVNWKKGKEIVGAWFLTIPCVCLFCVLSFLLLRAINILI